MLKMNSKAVAKLAKVSVRTLHHYDKIGLLVPSRNQWNDYREYSEADLAKLQQICFFKACGFSLSEIQVLLASSSFDRKQAFDLQKKYLLHEKERIDLLLATLDRSIQEIKGDIIMTQEEKFIGFEFTKENPYEQEARERWGNEAIDSNQEKLQSLSENAKQDLSVKMNTLFVHLATFVAQDPASETVQVEIDKLYSAFNQDFGYHYSLDAFAGVGKLYVSDARFTDNLSQYGSGFAQFLATAIAIYTKQV